jgi:hypothetical protein
MHEVKIIVPDKAYLAAKRRARKEGFGSAEIFLSNLVVRTVTPNADRYVSLFTPEVIATIDKAAQEARDGKGLTPSELDAYLAAQRAQWLESH